MSESTSPVDCPGMGVLKRPYSRSRTLRRFAWMLTAAVLAAPGAALAATCTVTDDADYNPTTDPVVTNTLRWCVEVIGNNDGTATDVVFDITSGSGPWQIDVEYLLHITEADTTIDGSTQSGYTSVNPSSSGSYGVILDGSTNVSAPLILIDGAGAEIRALRIKNHQAAAPPGPPPHAIQVAANGATIAQNRIEDCSGGIAVLQDVQNVLIGGSSSAEGNVIATTTNSDGIILAGVGTGNVLQHNVIDQAYGSGIFALDSAVSGGLAALVALEDNTVTYSGGDGYLIFDSRTSLEGNYSEHNTGAGFLVFDQSGVTDRMLVRDNFARWNQADGVIGFGTELSLWNNEVTGNGGVGIGLVTNLGADPSPDGTGPHDDLLAGGVIGSDSIPADENEIANNAVAGIFIIDATIDNIDTVEDDNQLSSNGQLEVGQFWPGAVYVESWWGDAYEGVHVEIWPIGGPQEGEDPLVEGPTDSTGHMVAEPGFLASDATTWPLIPAMVVFDDSGLMRFEAAPHDVVLTSPSMMVRSGDYAWDGDENSTGKSSSCGALTDPRCYQIFEGVMAPDCGGLESLCGPIESIDINGTDRNYVVCPANPAPDRPLVVGLHGGGVDATAESLDRSGGCRMLELSDRHHFVAAFPRALAIDFTPEIEDELPGNPDLTEYGWNDCRVDKRSEGAGEGEIDFSPEEFEDVDLVRDMILEIQNDLSTDPDRTYVWGHSNGGVLALRIATEFDANNPSDPAIRAVASNVGNEPMPTRAGLGSPSAENECGDPTSGADVLFMAGTKDDRWMPYSGGAPDGNDGRGFVRGANDPFYLFTPSTVSWWTSELGSLTQMGTAFEFFSDDSFLDGEPAQLVDGELVGNSTTTVTTYGTWAGPMVKYYEVDGGGHAMAGFQPDFLTSPTNDKDYCDIFPVLGQFGCASADYNGIDEMWNFFQVRLFRDDWTNSTDPEDQWDGIQENGEGDLDRVTSPTAGLGLDIVTTIATTWAWPPDANSTVAMLSKDLDALGLGTLDQFRARFFMDVEEFHGRFTVFSATDGSGNVLFHLLVRAFPLAVVGMSANGTAETDPVLIASQQPQLVEVEWIASDSGMTNGELCVRRIGDAATPDSVGTSAPEQCVAHGDVGPIDSVHLGAGNYNPSEASFPGSGEEIHVEFRDFETYLP